MRGCKVCFSGESHIGLFWIGFLSKLYSGQCVIEDRRWGNGDFCWFC